LATNRTDEAFVFEVTRVSRLPKAGVGLLEGKLLAGKVLTNSQAELVHAGQRIPLRVKGVALDAVFRTDGNLVLAVGLLEPAMALVVVGDRLIGVLLNHMD
jgi:hypothetical protein